MTQTSPDAGAFDARTAPAVPSQRTAADDTVVPAHRPRRAGAEPRTRQQEAMLRRAIGVAALAGIALIHLLDLPGKLSETPYLGVAYIGLVVASLVVAELLVRSGSALVWLAAGGIGAATIAGYVVNRTVGMPGAMDDIGNWLEPLGLASLFVEGVLVLVSVLAVMRGRRA